MTLAPSRPAPPPAEWSFQVEVPGYAGDLAGLAQRLRAGSIPPAGVPLLRLTRELLGWAGRFAREHPGTHAELLPALAGVIALKARLLLPAPEPEDDDPELLPEDGGELLGGVQALAELEELVRLLSRRRQEREGLIAAAPLDLGWPRRLGQAAGRKGLERLVRAARSAVREVQVPLLAQERLTLEHALSALRAFAGRLRQFRFGAVPAQDWGERGTYFAALLEGVRGGTFGVEQAEPGGEITVTHLGPPPD